MHFWIALNSNDQKHWAKSGESFSVAAEWVQELLANTSDPTRAAEVRKMDDLVAKYRKLVNDLHYSEVQNGALTADQMAAGAKEATGLEDAMTALGAELTSQYQDAAEARIAAATDSSDFARRAIFGVGLAGLFLGLLMALLFTRSISGPIIALTRTMRELAKGNLQIAPAHAADHNEIGEMARAVLVFRDAAVEKARLEAEAERQRELGEIARADNERAQRDAIDHERAIVAEFSRLGPVAAGGQGSALSHVPRHPRRLSSAAGRFQRGDRPARGGDGDRRPAQRGDPRRHGSYRHRDRRSLAAHRAAGGEPRRGGGETRRGDRNGAPHRRDHRSGARRRRRNPVRRAEERRGHSPRGGRDGRDREFVAAGLARSSA